MFSSRRKGNIGDIAVPIILLPVLVFFIIFGVYFYNESTSRFLTALNDSGMSDPKVTAIVSTGGWAINIFPTAIVLIIISMYIGAIISAFKIPSDPKYLIISILVLALYLILAILSTNITWEFINTTILIGTANNFPLMVAFIKYYPYISTALGFILIMAIYIKGPSEGNVLG